MMLNLPLVYSPPDNYHTASTWSPIHRRS